MVWHAFYSRSHLILHVPLGIFHACGYNSLILPLLIFYDFNHRQNIIQCFWCSCWYYPLPISSYRRLFLMKLKLMYIRNTRNTSAITTRKKLYLKKTMQLLPIFVLLCLQAILIAT